MQTVWSERPLQGGGGRGGGGVGGGVGPGFLHIFQTTPMDRAAHRHSIYYFDRDSGHLLFLQVIYMKPSFNGCKRL